MERVLQRLGVSVDGRRVLDVGCGRGYLRDFVLSHGGEYVGIDLVLDRLTRTAAANHGFVRADAHCLPLLERSVDAVFCLDSFEHYRDGLRVAQEFRRILRPRGLVFLSVPNYSNVAGLVKWFFEKTGLRPRNTWAPFGAWRPQALEQFVTAGYVQRIFRGAGFQRFRKLGYGAEVSIGLFPWFWHPCVPGSAEGLLRKLLHPLGETLVRLWPGASLHLFWAISFC